MLHADYTIGPEVHNDPYHIPAIRIILSRSLATLYPDLHDELAVATRELIQPSNGESHSELFPSHAADYRPPRLD